MIIIRSILQYIVLREDLGNFYHFKHRQSETKQKNVTIDATLYAPHSGQVKYLEDFGSGLYLCATKSMHSNLKEKRQILRDTVNHIQTIHKEKGTEERKIERAYLQNT